MLLAFGCMAGIVPSEALTMRIPVNSSTDVRKTMKSHTLNGVWRTAGKENALAKQLYFKCSACSALL